MFNKKQKKYFVITFAMLVFFTNTNSQNIINPTGFSKMDTSVLIKWNGKYSEFIDSRDGKKYRIVKIGNQVWMSQNLAYKPNAGKYWSYNNKEENVPRFGYLYTWETAKIVCPIGWHLSTKEEYELLIQNVSNNGAIPYNELIITGGSGFAAISSGLHLRSNFTPIEGGTGFWAVSEKNPDKAFSLSFFSDISVVKIEQTNTKKSGFPVRCIQDK